jgi:hypothetical protein
VVKARDCLACRQVERSVSFREPVVAIRLRHDSINQPVVLGVGVNKRAQVQVAENVPHANVRHPLSAPESVEVIPAVAKCRAKLLSGSESVEVMPAVAKCRAKLVSGSGRVDTFSYLSDSVFLLQQRSRVTEVPSD